MARVRQFRQRTTVAAVTVVALLSGGVLASAAVAVSAAAVQPQPLVAGRTLSGVVGKGGLSAVNAFGTWRGRPVDVVTNYLATDSWAGITDLTGQALTQYFAGSDVHRVWSVPLLPLQESASLEDAAAGAYNSKYASIAQQLVAGGDGSSTIRLGWEMTGDWYTWSGINDPAAFAGAWRQAVTAMRAVPGAHFTFDFNIAMGAANPVPMYPGDGYVDLIGGDNYDYAWTSSYPSSDHQKVWNGILTENYGLNWLASFAAQHGKRLSFPEWGVSWNCDGHGGGDDPYFIQQFAAWMAGHDVAYETYYDNDYSSCTKSALSDGLFPQAAAAYRALSSQPVSAPVTQPVSAPVTQPVSRPVTGTVAPVPAAPPTALDISRIQVAADPARSGGRSLFGATVTGAAYIWLVDSPGTTQVRFFLDRVASGAPTETETSAPWDLQGGSTAAANPLPAGTLAAGSHQLTVVATTATGVAQSATVSFTVG